MRSEAGIPAIFPYFWRSCGMLWAEIHVYTGFYTVRIERHCLYDYNDRNISDVYGVLQGNYTSVQSVLHSGENGMVN